VGDCIEAKVMPGRINRRYVALSVRELRDPWEEARGKYNPDQPVWGEVVDIRDSGVYIQIEPGVDGVIYPRDVPMRRNQYLTDVLGIGDHVMGVVKGVNEARSLYEVNLMEWLHRLSTVKFEKRRQIQQALLKKIQDKREKDVVLRERDISGSQERRAKRHAYPPLERLRRILVVDDQKQARESIAEGLKAEFGVPVHSVGSGREAVDVFSSTDPYDVAVLDMRLAGETGVDVAYNLLAEQPGIALVFMSDDPLAQGDLPKFHGQAFPFAVKEPDVVVEAVNTLRHGYWEERPPLAVQSDSFVRHLAMEAFADTSLDGMLTPIVASLREEVGADHVFVMEVNTTSREVAILAEDPVLNDQVRALSLDGLYHSPVQNVVISQEEFYVPFLLQDTDPRFKNFFQQLRFQTCLGVPVEVPDLAKHHALFLLRDVGGAFSDDQLDLVRSTAVVVQSALERAYLLEYMRHYEQRYTRGQLLGSLVHELRNKLHPLADFSKNLSHALDKLRKSSQPGNRGSLLQEADDYAADIEEVGTSLTVLLDAYLQMASGELGEVDVNDVVKKVKLNLEPIADDSQVEIYLDLDRELGRARAIASRLEQALTNLVLNAIQQISQQRREMISVARERHLRRGILQKGQVIVRTQMLDPKENARPIQISVIDTGPGIHYALQRDLFRIGVSARDDGHGLGLFISRDLVENMGGRLSLIDSLMFIGSFFRVDLSAY
jgi:signal transduction histidine kinase